MKVVILVMSLAITASTYAQADTLKLTFARQISRNFNYDTLALFSCQNVPPGLYAIVFKVDNAGKAYDFETNNKSVPSLNLLFIDAIKKTQLSNQSNNLRQGRYLQLVYFNNTIDCNAFRDRNNKIVHPKLDSTIQLTASHDKEIIRLLNIQLSSIETSIWNLQSAGFESSEYTILPIAVINTKKSNGGNVHLNFNNDTRQKEFSKKELKSIEESIRKQKEKKLKERTRTGTQKK